MSTETKHTPTPYYQKDDEIKFIHPNGREYLIARVFSGIKGNDLEEAKATAGLFVKCVNSHDKLLAALKAMINLAEYYEPPNNFNDEEKVAVKEARAAIARAEKGE